jgi:MFS family permease
MSPVVRICIAAFMMDLALNLMFTGMPYKVLALGGGALALGALPIAYSLIYASTASVAGRITDGTDRLRLARRLLPLSILAMVILMRATHLEWVFVAPAAVGLSVAFFWPALMGTMADFSAPGRLTAHLGWFNVSWSAGKALGFLMGGALLAWYGFSALFAVAAGSVVVVLLFLQWLPRSVPHLNPGGESTEIALEPLPPNQGSLLLAAWIANFTTFGATAALNFHYPAWLEAHDLPETVFGTFLGILFFSTTAAFVILKRNPGWRDRRLPLLLAPLPAILALAVLPRLGTPWAIFAAAPWIGFGLGQAYFASLYYSVRNPALRGRNAGIHEACVHSGVLILPLLGGIVASSTGRLEAPYWVAAGVGTAGLLVEMVVLAKSPRRG